MKIILFGTSAMKHSYSFIAPLRIARACVRHGDEVMMIDWADNRIDPTVLKEGYEKHKWGVSYTLKLEQMLPELQKQIKEWKPDLVYSMGTGSIWRLRQICKQHKIPLGLLVGDPYYANYPDHDLLNMYQLMDFITFNEGQAWNYVRTVRPAIANKCHLLLHAIDPELAPTLKEIQNTQKRFICSCVGGDDRIRRRELLLYFYQWTNSFPHNEFAVGGSLKYTPYAYPELDPKVIDGKSWNKTEFTIEEAKKLSDIQFNLFFREHDLTYPLGLSHKAVHKLYSESFYSFTPYGRYIVDGRVSKYNTMTFGTKIFEQMGSGSAIIANDIADLDMIIKDGETGFILKKPEDAYKAFKLAIDDPDKVRQMGLNAYNFAHKFHSWDNRYEEILLPIFKQLGIK